MCFLGSKLLGTLWASWTSWKSISFAKLGKFSFIIFSNKFSISCSSSSPSGTHMIHMLECLRLFQRFLSLSLFFWILVFFILFWLNVYFFLLVQIIDLSPSFLPFTVDYLYFFFISLCVAFIFSFILLPYSTNSVIILTVFWTLHLIGWLSLHCLVVFFPGAVIYSFIWAIFFCRGVPAT